MRSAKNLLPIRQKFGLKCEFRRFGIYPVPRTIDDNRSIFEHKHHDTLVKFGAQNTVSLGSNAITLPKKTYSKSAAILCAFTDRASRPDDLHTPEYSPALYAVRRGRRLIF